MIENGPPLDWVTLDEAGLRRWAAQYVGWATTEMGDPADLSWKLNDRFELARLESLSPDWDAYYQDEIIGGPYDDEFADAEYHSPVVVSIENGEPIIWDGWHRIACAIVRGDRHIMAIVGRD